MKLNKPRKHPILIKITFTEGFGRINYTITAIIDYIRNEIPDEGNDYILSLFPNIYDNAKMLSEIFIEGGFEKQVVFKEGQLYDLYVCYELMGKLLACSYRGAILMAFGDQEEIEKPEVQKNLYDALDKNIGPLKKEIDRLARDPKLLKKLPELKRRLLRLPNFQ